MEFMTFDTFDEMMDAIEVGSIEADGRVKPWQSEIKPGDFFVQTTPYDFLIFGIVLECDDEFYKSEIGRNFRFCKCYSVACEDGEMGDVHVSQIGKIITKETFDKFKDRNWVVEDGDEL